MIRRPAARATEIMRAIMARRLLGNG